MEEIKYVYMSVINGTSKRGLLFIILLHFPKTTPFDFFFDFFCNDITVYCFVFKLLFSSKQCILYSICFSFFSVCN